MSNGKPLTCLRCGAPIASGFECAACAAPRPSHAAAVHVDPPAEPARSDGPKLAAASLLALLMVAVLVYGGISGSAGMARDKAAAANKEAEREARYAKEVADRKARLAAVSQPTPSPAETPAPPPEPTSDPTATYTPPPALNDPAAPPSQATVIQKCYRCGGTGQTLEDCDGCDGDGVLECKACELYNFRYGRGGDPNCPTCHGASHQEDARGKRALGVAFVYTCPKCSGSGKAMKRCYLCHGTGEIAP